MSTPSRRVPPEALEKAWFMQAFNPELRVFTARVEGDFCYLSPSTLPLLDRANPSAAQYVRERMTPWTFIVFRSTDRGFISACNVPRSKEEYFEFNDYDTAFGGYCIDILLRKSGWNYDSEQFCDGCMERKTSGETKKCAGCSSCRYCSETCQIRHRPQHRSMCKQAEIKFKELSAVLS